MSLLLTGRTLIWSCYDPSGVITAAAHDILCALLNPVPIRNHLDAASAPKDVAADPSVYGIAIWRLSAQEEFRPICDALMRCRQRKDRPIAIVYADPDLAECTSILCEVGAQVVVSQVPSLQKVLRSVTRKAPLSLQGSHPLTSGLAERLPWPELDDNHNE